MNTFAQLRRLFRRVSGFSLVETALATAILAVVVVGLIGLIPSGTQTFQQAIDTTLATQISQRVLQDAEQSDFDTVIDRASLPPDPEGRSYCPQHFTFRAPKVSTPGWRYFDAQGSEVVPKDPAHFSEAERQAILYYVTMRVMPRAVLPTQNEGGGQVALLTVQIARNAAHQALEFTPGKADDPEIPERNLLRPGRVPIFTSSALVGRNHGR